jgi:hypothetical protein
MSRMVSRKDSDNEIYSASQLLSGMMVCNLEHQAIGHPAYWITYPDHDLEVLGSSDAVILCRFPTKSASA